MGRYPELDLSRVRTVSLSGRESLVSVDAFVDPEALGREGDPFDAFPEILAGRAVRDLADRMAAAARAQRPVLVMLGGHVVKTGVTPCLTRLAEVGVISAFAANGAVAIHDTEIALAGRTSERVERGLATGEFGMARETAEFVNRAATEGAEREEGLGEALGRLLLSASPPFLRYSLIAAAYRLGLPFTLHVAIGADVIHQHPSCDGRSVGETSLRDFRILSAVLRDIDGGVVVNLGSAVLLPEVFLKALNVARNLGHSASGFAAANCDFIQHYRPGRNVLDRPTARDGEAYALTGHHEILVPLLTRAILHRLGV